LWPVRLLAGVVTTTVVNLRSKEPFDVRIDRRSPWGNPYRIDEMRRAGLSGETARLAVIASFELWVQNADDAAAVWIREHVHELRGKTLACWCKPADCHGDVLAAMADAS
jgi:hypothetical protein